MDSTLLHQLKERVAFRVTSQKEDAVEAALRIGYLEGLREAEYLTGNNEKNHTNYFWGKINRISKVGDI